VGGGKKTGGGGGGGHACDLRGYRVCAFFYTHSPRVAPGAGGGLARFHLPDLRIARIMSIMLNLLCNTINDLVFYSVLCNALALHLVSPCNATGLILAFKLDLCYAHARLSIGVSATARNHLSQPHTASLSAAFRFPRHHLCKAPLTPLTSSVRS